MTCTSRTTLRRRRLVAAALALPLSLAMTGTALATGTDARGASADARTAAAAAPAVVLGPDTAADNVAAARVAADKPAPAEKAADKPAPVEKPAPKAAPVEKPAPKATDKPATGATAGAVSGKSAGTPTRDSSSDPAKHGTPTEGPLSKPQPLSKADQNGTGANPGQTCDHSYCSTRDGSASGNGVGDGEAKGKPCAGCVGKADNKNPRGQAPDGPTDHNAGYECDRNQGIGKTNPAHTGCTTPPVDDACPSIPGDQAAGTDCGGGKKKDDACPSIPGDQPAGTKCDDGGNGGERIEFCHATGSSTNPYVIIETSKAAAVSGHHGVDHQGARDIIPAFTYKGVSYPAQGNQALLATGCVAPGSTVTDACPDMPGDQPAGTVCTIGGGGGGGGSFDNCPNMPGNQPAGTVCTIGGGGGGGGGSFDNCPDMPGNQPANTVCTVGSPNPNPNPNPMRPTLPIDGVTPGQPAKQPVPAGPPAVAPLIVPNTAVLPAVLNAPAMGPAAAPAAAGVPSALPFTGTDLALLVELAALLLLAGGGFLVVARRERLARATA